jgi:uncharacterized DUF497 family protein
MYALSCIVNFEWDPLKDRENQQKHGVSYAEAARAWWKDDL